MGGRQFGLPQVATALPRLEHPLGGSGAGRGHGRRRGAYMDVFAARSDGPYPALDRQPSYRANHLTEIA